MEVFFLGGGGGRGDMSIIKLQHESGASFKAIFRLARASLS